MDRISVQPLPVDSGLVETTPEEVALYVAASGAIMTLARDGKLYRVLDPWERGDEAKPPA